MRLAAALLPLGIAALVVAAMAASAASALGTGATSVLDFCAYFTTEVSAFAVVALVWTGATRLTGRPASVWCDRLRAAATVYLAISALVHVLLLRGAPVNSGYHLPWANAVLYGLAPVYAALDWATARPRERPGVGAVGWLLAYPLIWVALTLLRGIATAWLPYPFLDVQNGYARATAYFVGVGLLGVVVGFLVVLRWRRAPVLEGRE